MEYVSIYYIFLKYISEPALLAWTFLIKTFTSRHRLEEIKIPFVQMM